MFLAPLAYIIKKFIVSTISARKQVLRMYTGLFRKLICLLTKQTIPFQFQQKCTKTFSAKLFTETSINAIRKLNFYEKIYRQNIQSIKIPLLMRKKNKQKFSSDFLQNCFSVDQYLFITFFVRCSSQKNEILQL